MAQNALLHDRPPVATSWLLNGSRAIFALIGGLVITFTFSFSSVTLGLAVFASYTVLFGIATFIWFPKVDNRAVRNASIAIGAASILASIIGFVMMAIHDATVSHFLLLVTVWAAITGFAELYLGFSKKGKFAEQRDWLFGGVMTCLLALATLIIDPNYRQDFVVPGKDELPDYEGAVTGSLFGVGVFGVYLIVIGVFLFIGAYSLRTPQQRIEGNSTS